MSVPVEKYHVRTASTRDDWETPPIRFAEWDAEFGFTLDVCATDANAKCARYFTPELDGLAQDWGWDVCWMNPPYGRAIARWMEKAHAARDLGATVVALVPARTDTGWWHEHVIGAGAEVRFLRGRIAFLQDGAHATHATRSGAAAAPFPCALVIYRPDGASK